MAHPPDGTLPNPNETPMRLCCRHRPLTRGLQNRNSKMNLDPRTAFEVSSNVTGFGAQENSFLAINAEKMAYRPSFPFSHEALRLLESSRRVGRSRDFWWCDGAVIEGAIGHRACQVGTVFPDQKLAEAESRRRMIPMKPNAPSRVTLANGVDGRGTEKVYATMGPALFGAVPLASAADDPVGIAMPRLWVAGRNPLAMALSATRATGFKLALNSMPLAELLPIGV